MLALLQKYYKNQTAFLIILAYHNKIQQDKWKSLWLVNIDEKGKEDVRFYTFSISDHEVSASLICFNV